MLNLSNILSLSRAGFALAFLQDNPWVRLLAIGLAMLSDFLDGYLARLQKTTTQFGAILDPIMDKFFVFFSGGVFFLENKLTLLGLAALLSRDISLCFFGLFLGIVRGWDGYEVRAIWWGKITTIAQFGLLICLTLNLIFPKWVYLIFVTMAAFAFFELLLRYYRDLNRS
ncbi:MAG: CDP-alcohol phosphatidyltransferase family protein [Chlamydiales bacterium]